MPELVFRFDDGGEEVFSLAEDRVGVGRETDNRIVIDNDFISGHHAVFVRNASGGFRLCDLGSQNGTFVNGEAIGEALLKHGDRIRFGVYEVGYRDGREAVQPSLAAVSREARLKLEEARLDERIRVKQEHLESLEFRVAQMEDIARSLEGRLVPIVNPVALAMKGADLGGSLIDEVERLETRYEEVRRQLDERREQLREMTKVRLPEAEAELAQVRLDRDEANVAWDRLRKQIDEAEARKRSFDAMEDGYQALQASVKALEKEHVAKKELLQMTGRDLAQAEEKLRETQRKEREARSRAEEVDRRRGIADEECREFAKRLQEQAQELQDVKGRISSLRAEIASEQERHRQTVAEREESGRLVRHAQERFRLAEDRVKGVISNWDEFEKTRLGEIAQRKLELDEQYASSEIRLRKAREELQTTRTRIEAELEEGRRRIEELRSQQYEPAKQLHEELMLRSEAVAAELASQERRLESVRRTIRDGEATEKLVAHSLERRGQALETLEQRIGEEVDQIRAEFVSLQRPLTWEGPAPVPDFGPIFRTREGPPALLGRRVAPNPSDRTGLVVYLPDHGERTWDFRRHSELKVEDEPLPTGFAGLAAATRGAVFTSLAMTVESELPVLFPPVGDLASAVSVLKKLRSAMPKRVILGGWTRKVFEALTEELHAGTNFQDLIGVLATSNGSVTTDPYMNTFFESMNHGNRFLYLAPVLPWNPRAHPSFEGRKGLLADLNGFDPDDLSHQRIIRELRDWVEESRAVITVNEPSRGVTRRFREQLGLGPDWVLVQNPGGYRDWLETLRARIAVVSFQPLEFSSDLLRDALLCHVPILAPNSEIMSVFYPELVEYAAGRVLPVPAALRRIFQRETHERLTRQADKRLLSEHSYQAAAKKLDEFLASIAC